ncbi:MAG: dienelactone hydrolase [Vicinamibacteria bacterium]
MPRPIAPHALALLGGLALAGLAAAGPAYDPLAIPAGWRAETVDLAVNDAGRGREIPLRVYLPSDRRPAPVVLFSHGLGGSARLGYVYLGEHWSARGYVVVMMQHPGSDDAVWREAPAGGRREALRRAANPRSFLERAGDVRAVLDALARWQAGEAATALAGRLDLGHVGMAGHSFGAVTTQAVSGQSFAGRGPALTDARIAAALAMSPSSPRDEARTATAFSSVRVPWMLMTGTRDVAPIGNATVLSRRAVFDALPPGSKYELVLDGAEHSAFTDRELAKDREPRNPAHHRAILAVGTAFWDEALRGDPAARAWLDGAGPASVLGPKDEWRKK